MLSEEDDITIFVADESAKDRIVGAIVFGPSHLTLEGIGPSEQVYSLGVVHDRRQQHIGSDLKLAAMADAAARGIHHLLSQVHKSNHHMNLLNARIGVATSGWAEDEYHLTAVRIRLSMADRAKLLVRAKGTTTN